MTMVYIYYYYFWNVNQRQVSYLRRCTDLFGPIPWVFGFHLPIRLCWSQWIFEHIPLVSSSQVTRLLCTLSCVTPQRSAVLPSTLTRTWWLSVPLVRASLSMSTCMIAKVSSFLHQELLFYVTCDIIHLLRSIPLTRSLNMPTLK